MILMLSIVWVRTLITPDFHDGYHIVNLKKAFYPTAALNEQGSWEMDFSSMSAQSDDVADFMKYSDTWPGAYFKSRGSGAGANLLKELTVFQEKSPFFFTPPHCMKHGNTPFTSPIVGYVKSDSEIQADVIEQLSLLFSNQKEMIGMLGAIAQEGAGNDPDSESRMNLAIAKFIGMDFITQSILMDQGFDQTTAKQMAQALSNTDATDGKSQQSILKALGLGEEQANQVAALFRIQSEGLDLAALEQLNIIDTESLGASKTSAISYLLSVSNSDKDGAAGFDLAALYKMGIFDELPLTTKQRKSLNTYVAISSGNADEFDIEDSFFEDIGLSSEQAQKLATAF
jgi:hypothetical protein